MRVQMGEICSLLSDFKLTKLNRKDILKVNEASFVVLFEIKYFRREVEAVRRVGGAEKRKSGESDFGNRSPHSSVS